MRKITGVLASLLLVTLAGCGGSGNSGEGPFNTPGGGGGGGGAGGTTVARMGNNTGSSFQEGVMAVSSARISAGGSTSLTVSIVSTSANTLFTDSVSVGFSSTCSATGRATITSPVTTTTGIATATYVATGCSGDDVITATAVATGLQLQATGTVNVAPASVGSIEFVSATPTNISLQGTGGVNRSETSTVVFRVVDSTGGSVADSDVDFSLNTSVGGITFSPQSARSDANGRVQTVVQAGTVATTVRVTARVRSTQISTQSNQLTITTGIPDSDSLSLAVEKSNVESWAIDGVVVPVTVRLADRFNNPVPDGTAVTFTTEGGRIDGQCLTATTSSESGVCSVNWVSSEPRPANGRVTIIATAIGEESFSDTNGNGALDAGENFVDEGEPFRDDNEDGVYQAGVESFYDFNNNGLRDSPDSLFNGVLCRDTARCDATKASAGIGRRHLIIMSDGNAAQFSSAPASIDVSATSPQNVDITVRDLNGNPMPVGTTVSASTSNGSVGPRTTYTVPNTTAAAGSSINGVTLFRFSVSHDTTSSDGTLSITVKSPGGIQTYLDIPVHD
ncbi:MAG: hypothetical protein U1F14_14180 [Steroidobacteraceae bacterium]